MKRKNSRKAKSNPKATAGKRRSQHYSRLRGQAKRFYDQTTSLITDVRGNKGPWPELLKKHHLSSKKARELAGRDLLGGTRDKPVRASKADRRVRDLWFPDSFGDVRIRTRSSRDASTISDYYNDRDKLLGNKISPEEFEAKWRGVRVNDRARQDRSISRTPTLSGRKDVSPGSVRTP